MSRFQACLAAGVEYARGIPEGEKIVWPASWPAPELVAAALAQMCAELEAACQTSISKGFVRAKPMKGRPEKPETAPVAP